DATALGTLLQTLYRFPKPTIALVQGAAYGGGAGLACACDLVLASTSATFCFSEAKLGLIPAIISPYIIEAMGDRQAKAYFLTSEIIDAQKALTLGLCHHIIPENITDDHLTHIPIINNILKNGPEAISHIKKWVNVIKSCSTGSDDTLKITAERIADIRVSPEGKEGISAFIEKRDPNWIIN